MHPHPTDSLLFLPVYDILIIHMPDDQPKYRTSTPLMEALYLGDDQKSLRRVKELLASGEDPNKFDAIAEANPLYTAWISDNAQIMRILIEAGADGKIVADLPFDLSWSFSDRSIETTLLLIESGFALESLYHQNELGESICNGENLIVFLLDDSQYDYIEAIKPHGILDFINIYDCMGGSPLGDMARDGHLEQAKWLIQHGANVNAHCQGSIGDTALDRAIESTDVEMTRFLLAAGANPNIPTWMWITATDRAVNFMADFEFRRNESRTIPDAVKIREMILEACIEFPRPTMHDGSQPEVWPPKPRIQ
jgi:ankyrin repeat protein